MYERAHRFNTYFNFKFTFLGANQTHTLICTYFVFQPTGKAQKIRRRYKDGERKTRNRLKCLFRGGRFLSGSFICLFAVCVAFVHAVVVLCVCMCVCVCVWALPLRSHYSLQRPFFYFFAQKCRHSKSTRWDQSWRFGIGPLYGHVST
jgi:hypothetical protein